MTFKTLLAGLCTALVFSIGHAAPVYSVVHGQNLDLYYDASAFGSDVTAVGDNFVFKSNSSQFSASGSAYVVAHQGVSLYGGYSASFSGDYRVSYAEQLFLFAEVTKGFYYDTNLEPIPYQKDSFITTTNSTLAGDGWDPHRTGSTGLGASSKWWADQSGFGRINMDITLFAQLVNMGDPVQPDSYLHIDNFSFNFKTVSAVPEPETYAMLLAGLALMVTRTRRRKS